MKRNRLASGKQMLKDLNMLNVNQNINLNVYCLVYKLKNNLLPSYLCDNLLYVHNIYSNMNLKNSTSFRIPLYNKSKTQQNIFYKGLQDFNRLPNYIKNSNNIGEFKKQMFRYLMNEQNDTDII